MYDFEDFVDKTSFLDLEVSFDDYFDDYFLQKMYYCYTMLRCCFEYFYGDKVKISYDVLSGGF